MVKQKQSIHTSKLKNLKQTFFRIWNKRSVFGRVLIIFSFLLTLITSLLYGSAVWYQSTYDDDFRLGATFIPEYARYFDLDPEYVLEDSIDNLGIKHYRMVSYWEIIEKNEGSYDFSELDWQFKMAEEKGATISLSIGLRQPRWPECHMPDWAAEMPFESWKPKLYNFIQATVERYKNSPALESYQLENEYFFTLFTRCLDNSRERLVEEFDLVRSIDPDTPIIMSLSGDFGVAVGSQPQPDEYGMAVYKRVYEDRFLNRYIEYPYPSWLYASRAGIMLALHGKRSSIHEIQAEPWTPSGNIKESSIDEQYKSMSPKRFKSRIKFIKETGMGGGELWGLEWWYYLKDKQQSPEMYETAKSELDKYNN